MPLFDLIKLWSAGMKEMLVKLRTRKLNKSQHWNIRVYEYCNGLGNRRYININQIKHTGMTSQSR